MSTIVISDNKVIDDNKNNRSKSFNALSKDKILKDAKTINKNNIQEYEDSKSEFELNVKIDL